LLGDFHNVSILCVCGHLKRINTGTHISSRLLHLFYSDNDCMTVAGSYAHCQPTNHLNYLN